MSKYKSQSNRCFYCGIYYYLNHPYGFKRKALKILKRNMLMCTRLSFVIRFYNNVTNRISKTAQND